MATCSLAGKVVDITETAVSGATIRANVATPTFSSNNLIVPYEVTTTSASDGTWSLTLSQGLNVILAIDFPPNATASQQRKTYSIIVPSASSGTFNASLATEL